jgi:hypothetical protein
MPVITDRNGRPVGKEQLQQMFDRGLRLVDVADSLEVPAGKISRLCDKLGVNRPRGITQPPDPYKEMSDDELIRELIYNKMPGCKCPTCKIISEIEFRLNKNTHRGSVTK